MKFLYHVFGMIFFIIWSVIGLVLIVGAFTVVKTKPWDNLAPIINSLGVGGLTGGLGSSSLGTIQESMKKMGQFGTVKGFYNSLKPAEQACLGKQLGEKNLADILANPQYKPTPDLLLKGVQCLNTK